MRVAIRQRFPGEARNAIAAVFSSLANVKNVFVVDPDIDIFSDEQMEWALATRFQARPRPLRRGRLPGVARSIRRSRPGETTGSKAGFDLTLPLRTGGGLEAQIPDAADVCRQLASRRSRAALADGPKYFEALMAAVGSDDGRDVVRELESLRRAGVARPRRRRPLPAHDDGEIMAQDIRDDLVAGNRILAHFGVVDAYGHVSARDPQNPKQFLLSRSRSPELVDRDDIVTYGLDGEPAVAGESRPGYLERYIHAGIYAARPDVQRGRPLACRRRRAVRRHEAAAASRCCIHPRDIGLTVPVWDIREKFGDQHELARLEDRTRQRPGAAPRRRTRSC